MKLRRGGVGPLPRPPCVVAALEVEPAIATNSAKTVAAIRFRPVIVVSSPRWCTARRKTTAAPRSYGRECESSPGRAAAPAIASRPPCALRQRPPRDRRTSSSSSSALMLLPESQGLGWPERSRRVNQGRLLRSQHRGLVRGHVSFRDLGLGLLRAAPGRHHAE